MGLIVDKIIVVTSEVGKIDNFEEGFIDGYNDGETDWGFDNIVDG